MMTRVLSAILLILAAAGPAAAQTPAPARSLSLEDALRLAERGSEALGIARAALRRARGDQLRARSEYFPQLTGTASYTRTLESQFEGLSGAGGEPDPSAPPAPRSCTRFIANPTLPIDQRVDSLERAVECLSAVNPFAAFSDLPFGQENQYTFGLQLSQNLFAGGRIRAQNRAAAAGRRSAELGLTAAQAQLALDVTQAYFDAALSERLLAIAEATLEQAESTLAQTQLARRVGTQPEFELLRARVTRDNQRPVVIQRRAARDIALLRLKQLLNLPAGERLELTTTLGDTADDSVAAPPALPTALATPATDVAPDQRAPVQQAAEALRAQEAQLAAARAQRLPTLALTSRYAKLAFPASLLPGEGDFVTDWTVGLSLQLPLFTGGRIKGDVLVAEANLEEARERLQQTRELAELDTRDVLARLEAAEAAWEASRGTVEQAARAYQIAELRYREGISTQLELADARILLQQAQANRAQAARDLQVARVQAALLPHLPLGGAGATGPVTAPSLTAPRRAADPRPTNPITQAGLTTP
ncbi:MAG TPA: TolC family protein [Gemmatimonadales bacterium]|nr:TolC family protein [Gemmatimonadales bacterium]